MFNMPQIFMAACGSAANLDRPDAPAIRGMHAAPHEVAAAFVGIVTIVIWIATIAAVIAVRTIEPIA